MKITGDIKEHEGAVEAILFAAGEPLESERIAGALEITVSEIDNIIKKINNNYISEKRGFLIIRLENKYQMSSSGHYAEEVRRAVVGEGRTKRLTGPLLEVLAIVAYRQPVTRQVIEHIRGVNCDYPLERLLQLNLIAEEGRLQAPGKPFLYVTTDEFLRRFGLENLGDLPGLPEEMEEVVLDVTNDNFAADVAE